MIDPMRATERCVAGERNDTSRRKDARQPAAMRPSAPHDARPDQPEVADIVAS